MEGSARELLAECEPNDDGGESDRAERFLLDELREGPRPQKEMEREYKDGGFSLSTIKRAKKSLGIRSAKAGMTGPWLWSLPGQEHEVVHEGVHTLGMNPFAKREPLLGITLENEDTDDDAWRG